MINAVTGGPNQLTTEDIIDVPFKEQGDFFVRCLATQIVPEDAKRRRATSVSGVMVSVFDIEDVAREALSTAEQQTASAQASLDQVETRIKALDERIAAEFWQCVRPGRSCLGVPVAPHSVRLDKIEALTRVSVKPEIQRRAKPDGLDARPDVASAAMPLAVVAQFENSTPSFPADACKRKKIVNRIASAYPLLAQRPRAALRAIAERSSGVNTLARAWPPRRPSDCAALSLPSFGGKPSVSISGASFMRSAGRFWPLGPLGMGPAYSDPVLRAMLGGKY